MKKVPLDMQHQFTTRSSEVVKLTSDLRCVIKQASCVQCVANTGPRLDMLIWFVD